MTRPLAVSKFEITEGDFAVFRAAAGIPSATPADDASRPVVNVSWDDAVAYSVWLSAQSGSRYRLPTEHEWEYAAAAAEDDARGDPEGARPAGASPVGTGAANRWGLHDLDGNVAEWIEGCADGDADDCTARIRRGGSWAQTSARAGTAARATSHGALRSFDTGFRVVREID